MPLYYAIVMLCCRLLSPVATERVPTPSLRAFHAVLQSTWPGLRHFQFVVNAVSIKQGISDVNAKFGTSYSTVPSEWALSHMNVEVEGLAGAACGYAMQNLQILLPDCVQ